MPVSTNVLLSFARPSALKPSTPQILTLGGYFMESQSDDSLKPTSNATAAFSGHTPFCSGLLEVGFTLRLRL
jgi:hypothetical protein